MEPRVTIAVVPGERFGQSEAALRTLYDRTAVPFRLIFIDAGSPLSLRRTLRRESVAKGFELVRVDRFLTPNRARNLAIARCRTEFIAFVDNDLIVSPTWLENMLTCADATGAAVVGPTYLEGGPGSERIDMACGDARIEERATGRCLVNSHRHAKAQLAAVVSDLQRAPTELVEFHCALVRRSVFDTIGPLEDRLLSTREHVDFCLSVREAGGEIWYEPSAVVRYSFEGRMTWHDLQFLLIRWSHRNARVSMEAFSNKWRLAPDDPALERAYSFSISHRRKLIAAYLRQWLPKRIAEGPPGQAFASMLERRMERRVAAAVPLSIDRPATRAT